MKLALKSALASALAATLLIAVPQAQADGGHGRWKHHSSHHRHHDHHGHWGHRHDRVVVIREPRYVVRERAYVYDEPAYVYRSRPSLVIGVNVPPLIVGF
jgi:Ni/Co efflux regulator RcnB